MAIPLCTCLFKLPMRPLVCGPCLFAAVVLNAGYSTTVAAEEGDLGSATHPVVVRDIDRPARDPVQLSPSDLSSYTVPDGKLLIIEHVAGACAIPHGAGGFLNTLICGHVSAQGPEQCFNLVPVLTGNDSKESIYAFSQPIRMYIAAGTRIFVDSATAITRASAGCRASISGYLVDAPGLPTRTNPPVQPQ